MRLIHVGMGKTATTFLQVVVFKFLAKEKFINSFNPATLTPFLHYAHRGSLSREEIDHLHNRICSEDELLISMESLFGWDPENWEYRAVQNRKIFGKKADILLTIRDPLSFLTSVFVQRIRGGFDVKPEYFFLNESDYKRVRRLVPSDFNYIFNVDKFDLEHLIRLYVQNFQSVTVLPVESINNVVWLKSLFDIDNEMLDKVKKNVLTSSRKNSAFSNCAVLFSRARIKLLKILNLRPVTYPDNAVERVLSQFDVASKKQSRVFLYISFFKSLFTWRSLMENVVQYIFPNSRYKLPPETYLGFKFRENIEFYESILSQLDQNGTLIIQSQKDLDKISEMRRSE